MAKTCVPRTGAETTMNQDTTTLICLFHHRDHAQAAMADLLNQDIPEANVTLIGPGSSISSNRSSLTELNVPERDVDRLLRGLEEGGALLTVSAISDHVDNVESIFQKHSAGKIDEAVVDDDMSAAALPLAGGGAFAIDQDESAIGQRSLSADGVRVYGRVVEIPVEGFVTLVEEPAEDEIEDVPASTVTRDRPF